MVKIGRTTVTVIILLAIILSFNFVYYEVTGRTILEDIKEAVSDGQEGVSAQVVAGAEDDLEENSDGVEKKFGVNITIIEKAPLNS